MLEGDGTLYITKTGNYAKFDESSILSGVPEAKNIELTESTPTKGSYGIFKVADQVTEPFEIIDVSTTEAPEAINSYELFDNKGTLYLKDTGEYEVKQASDRSMEHFDVEGAEPMLGETGTFVIHDKAVNPFEVVSLQKVAGAGNYEIVGYDGLQKISYYPIKMKKPELIPHETIKNAYYVPGNAEYVKLSGGKMHRGLSEGFGKTASFSPVKITTRSANGIHTYYPTSNTSEDMVNHLTEKNASYLPDNASFIELKDEISVDYTPQVEKVSHYVGRDNAGLYYLNGPEFDKYASLGHETRNLDKQEATWALIHCNGSDHDVEKVASLNISEVGAVRSALSSPKAVKDIENEIMAQYEKSAEKIKSLKVDLVKEASVLEDKTTVDAVLSLNLLNKENLMDYINLAPNLEKTSSDLAKTLMTVRMGLSHIPEGAVKTAMESVSSVAKVLRELEAVVSTNK